MLWMAAALSGAWELWALQSPGTPLYIGMLSGPIASLRELTTAFGTLLILAGLLMPRAGFASEPKLLVAALHLGALLAVGAQLYAALHGMYGDQASDLRPDAFPVFAVKNLGFALLIGPLLELGRRVLIGRGPST
jgi:hypothetical protein